MGIQSWITFPCSLEVDDPAIARRVTRYPITAMTKIAAKPIKKTGLEPTLRSASDIMIDGLFMSSTVEDRRVNSQSRRLSGDVPNNCWIVHFDAEVVVRLIITTALRGRFADLSPKEFDCGRSAPHHQGFRVEATLVQRGAPIIKLCENIYLAACGTGSLVINNMYVGHTAE